MRTIRCQDRWWREPVGPLMSNKRRACEEARPKQRGGKGRRAKFDEVAKTGALQRDWRDGMLPKVLPRGLSSRYPCWGGQVQSGAGGRPRPKMGGEYEQVPRGRM